MVRVLDALRVAVARVSKRATVLAALWQLAVQRSCLDTGPGVLLQPDVAEDWRDDLTPVETVTTESRSLACKLETDLAFRTAKAAGKAVSTLLKVGWTSSLPLEDRREVDSRGQCGKGHKEHLVAHWHPS